MTVGSLIPRPALALMPGRADFPPPVPRTTRQRPAARWRCRSCRCARADAGRDERARPQRLVLQRDPDVVAGGGFFGAGERGRSVRFAVPIDQGSRRHGCPRAGGQRAVNLVARVMAPEIGLAVVREIGDAQTAGSCRRRPACAGGSALRFVDAWWDDDESVGGALVERAGHLIECTPQAPRAAGRTRLHRVGRRPCCPAAWRAAFGAADEAQLRALRRARHRPFPTASCCGTCCSAPRCRSRPRHVGGVVEAAGLRRDARRSTRGRKLSRLRTSRAPRRCATRRGA